MSTIWLDVPSMPGISASSDGDLRRGSEPVKVFLKPRGVPRFNHQGKIRIVAHAVAEAFHGPRPDRSLVLHADDDPQNNRPENLSYGTKSQNSLDNVRNGRHPQASKTRCKRGHLLSGDNLHIERGGGRRCRQCKRDLARQR